jgi:hypothetical protein
LQIDGNVLRAGDGMSWIDTGAITLQAVERGEALLFDLKA